MNDRNITTDDRNVQRFSGWGISMMQEKPTAEYVLAAHYDALVAENERLREAMQKIVQWADAYPLDIFPEPDFKKAHEVLTANGMTLDAISASCMRRVVTGVGNIARSAFDVSGDGK